MAEEPLTFQVDDAAVEERFGEVEVVVLTLILLRDTTVLKQLNQMTPKVKGHTEDPSDQWL